MPSRLTAVNYHYFGFGGGYCCKRVGFSGLGGLGFGFEGLGDHAGQTCVVLKGRSFRVF